jgi:hypothetical protein
VPDVAEAACGELSTVLWCERDLLDGLAFTLEVQRLVLASGDPRWLPRACRAVDVILRRLCAVELVRAVRVDILAAELGLPPAPGLRALARAVDDPWSDLLRHHRDAMVGAAREIDGLAARNHRGLARHREASGCPSAGGQEAVSPDGRA